jgi:hypothetical protein
MKFIKKHPAVHEREGDIMGINLPMFGASTYIAEGGTGIYSKGQRVCRGRKLRSSSKSGNEKDCFYSAFQYDQAEIPGLRINNFEERLKVITKNSGALQGLYSTLIK